MWIDRLRSQKFVWAALCLLATPYSLAFAATPPPPPKQKQTSDWGAVYIGAFGGGGSAGEVPVTQWGLSFNNPNATMALPVDAHGKSGNFGSYITGGHVGYEFDTGMCLIPALEFEGFYLCAISGTTTGPIMNPSFEEHEFIDILPLRTTAFLVDFLLSVRPPQFKWLEPYVGGGIGGAILSINGAVSTQVSPPEPGINHFNSRTTASDSALTAQFKGGLRVNLTDHWRLFGEYRYLYVGSTDYIFGFTLYPFDHAPTTNWLVDLGSLHYNLGVGGVEYRF